MRTLVLLLLALGPAQAQADRDGFFIGFGLGLGQGNFDVDSEDDNADVALYGDVNLGFAWPSGFGIGGGASVSDFRYRLEALGEDLAEFRLTFVALDASGFYFLPLGKRFELAFRGGLSATSASLSLNDESLEEESSAGVHLGIGGHLFFGKTFALVSELFYRTYGVAFVATNEEEVTVSGVWVGVRWR